MLSAGWRCDKARANGDGPGDHARAMAAFLTGRQARKTHGADIRVGMSADQHVATADRRQDPVPVARTRHRTRPAGRQLRLGYACAYSSNLSWRGESTPNAKECDPKAVFDRLFSGTDPKELAAARAKRELYNKSILDFVMEDAKGLERDARLGRPAEARRIPHRASARSSSRFRRRRPRAMRPPPKPNMPAPTGIPKERAGPHPADVRPDWCWRSRPT